MRKEILVFLSFFLSILIIILLLSAIDLSEMVRTIMAVNIYFYALAFLFSIASAVSRALRLFVLFKPNNFGNYFLIICGHRLLNKILPFRTGEVSLPFFLKRISDTPYSQSILLFFLLRIFDIISLFVIFLVILFFWGFKIEKYIILLIVFSLVISMLCLLNLKRLLHFIFSLLLKLIPGKFNPRIEVFQRLIKKSESVSLKKLLILLFLSFADKISNYVMTILLVVGMNFKIHVFQLIVANTFASLSNILPINSFGSFGTLELGWAGALIFCGISKEIAISSGFSFHILTFSFTISLGLVSIFLMKLKFNINPFIREKNVRAE